MDYFVFIHCGSDRGGKLDKKYGDLILLRPASHPGGAGSDGDRFGTFVFRLEGVPTDSTRQVELNLSREEKHLTASRIVTSIDRAPEPILHVDAELDVERDSFRRYRPFGLHGNDVAGCWLWLETAYPMVWAVRDKMNPVTLQELHEVPTIAWSWMRERTWDSQSGELAPPEDLDDLFYLDTL